jgi:hypothetical protein
MLSRLPPLSTRASWPGGVGAISVEPKPAGTLGRVCRTGTLAARPIVETRMTSIRVSVIPLCPSPIPLGPIPLGPIPLQRGVRAGAFLTLAGVVLGQAHFIEDESRSLDEPERHQTEGQVLPEPAAEYERAGDARDDEQRGGAEAYDPGSFAQAAPPAVIACYSSESSSASGTSSSASSSTNPIWERPSPMPSRSERSGSGPPNPVRPSPSVRPSSAARSS